MEPLSYEKYKDWMKMRKRTMYVFVFETLLIGMDFTLTFLSLWKYLKDMVNPVNPKAWYTGISVSFLGASLLLTGVIGKYVDRTRNVRITFFTVNTFVICGNLLYAIPYSPFFLLFGRLLAGIAGPLRSVMAGEIVRSFPSNELSGKMSFAGAAYSLGWIVGPVFNMIFTEVDVTILSLRVKYMNVCGLYMAAFFSIAQILAFFFLADLSKIYDLKQNTSETALEDSEDQDDINNDFAVDGMEASLLVNNNEINSLEVLKEMFSNFDPTLVLLLAFMQAYFGILYDMWLPLIIYERLHWSVTELSLITFGSGLGCIVGTVILIWCNPPNKTIFYIAVCNQIGNAIMNAIIMVLFYCNANRVLDLALWAPYCAVYVINIIVEEVFLVNALAQMVSSKYQVFTDGIRLTAYRLGSLLAISIAASIFSSMMVVGIVHIVVSIVGFVLLVIRWKTMKEPKMVIK